MAKTRVDTRRKRDAATASGSVSKTEKVKSRSQNIKQKSAASSSVSKTGKVKSRSQNIKQESAVSSSVSKTEKVKTRSQNIKQESAASSSVSKTGKGKTRSQNIKQESAASSSSVSKPEKVETRSQNIKQEPAPSVADTETNTQDPERSVDYAVHEGQGSDDVGGLPASPVSSWSVLQNPTSSYIAPPDDAKPFSSSGDDMRRSEAVTFGSVFEKDSSVYPRFGPAALVMKAFFDHHGVVSQNINSFNKFLTSYIQDIITEEPIVTECHSTDPFPIRHEIHFTNVFINLPKRNEGDGRTPRNVTPNDCINRSLTYASDIYAKGHIIKCEYQNNVWVEVPLSEIELSSADGRKVRQTRTSSQRTTNSLPVYKKPFFIPVGQLPVMVRSKVCQTSNFKSEADHHKNRECSLDPGGYFIINGKERVLVAQEKMPENRAVIYEVMKHFKFEYECEILSSLENSSRPVAAFWVRLMKEKTVSFGKIFKDSSNLEGDEENGNGDEAVVTEGNDEEEEEQEEKTASTTFVCGRQFVVVIPRLKNKKPIPIVLLLKALGCASPSEAKAYVLQGDGNQEVVGKISYLLQYSLDLWDEKQTQNMALQDIGSMTMAASPEMSAAEIRDLGREIISDYILPNVGTDPKDDLEKIRFICEMTRRVCDTFFGWRKPEKRDNLINKRFELAGTLFLQLFKRLWKQVSFDLQHRIKKRLDMNVGYNLKDLIRPSIITNGFTFSLATGNWTDRKGSGVVSSGISQELNRLSFLAALSHLRRVTAPSKLHRNITARQLQLTNWGMICPNETPEGEPVGLVQNFALSACISVGCSTAPILEYLNAFGMIPSANCSSMSAGAGKILLNGNWIGIHTEPEELVSNLRALRRHGSLNPEVSIALTKRHHRPEVCIQTEAGRIYRPLLIVENKKSKLTPEVIAYLESGIWGWEDLLRRGVVEQLDTAEITNTLIAMWESVLVDQPENDYTHCEIHPSMILGLGASTIPFPDHNQAPRNTYQSGMAKQAIGLYATNFQRRCDLLSHVMHYPHQPLTTTFGAEMCNLWKLPGGQECIVAILCHTGYNQEDSIIMNQSSIERGLLRSSVYQTYIDAESHVTAKREKDELFERPGKLDVRFLKVQTYEHLEDDGLPAVGTRIKEREVVIGKTSNSGGIKSDSSVTAKLNTKAVVSQAFITTNQDGQRTHKVVLQETRCPKIGDKFASRHGQKGVIGMIYTQEDMPFTKDGIVPDVILNPHAIPSRMTIGHLVEALAGKAICLGKGNVRHEIDATAFTKPVTKDTFSKYLTDAGFQKYGEEVMYDGATGHKMNATVFMGVNYYQRLRHMVDDKINVRNRGAVTQLEGQPKRGLTRDGAQRFGEMERDCTVSHGAAAFLHERLFTVSDAAYYKVCNYCGSLVSLEPYVNKELCDSAVYRCKLCDRKNLASDNLSTIALPKAAKLLYQELVCMNIRPCFKVSSDFRRKPCVKVDKSKIVPLASKS